jgi:hypothetical protein
MPNAFDNLNRQLFFRNRSRPYCTKTRNMVKTKHGRGKPARISQKIGQNHQRASKAN